MLSVDELEERVDRGAGPEERIRPHRGPAVVVEDEEPLDGQKAPRERCVDEHVEGEVRLKLYKGNVTVIGRESPKSLYSSTLVTFEDDKGAYDQKDAEGFIRLNALRLRTLAARNRR